METESPPPASSSSTSKQHHQRRQICGNCNRPIPVCLCHVIPTTPIKTSTHILIVHHPLESHHKLNTVHLLSKSLQNVTTHLSRKLLPSHITHYSPSTTIYLFPPSPGSPAVNLSELKESLNSSDNLRLVVFDGTWKHAKEMVKASRGVLESLRAKKVCLDVDESLRGGTIFDDELVLRKEPFKGCVSTLEAVARCLRVVEADNGEEIERALVGILREMVRLQAAFLKPVKPRPKLLKLSKQNQLKTC